MEKEQIIEDVMSEMKEEHEASFREGVKNCLREINSISAQILSLEKSLSEKRKNLSEMELKPLTIVV
jgi:hypothetical protein